MKAEITGTVMDGVLQFDQRIDLPDHSRVRVAVEPVGAWREQCKSGLKAWQELRQSQPSNSIVAITRSLPAAAGRDDCRTRLRFHFSPIPNVLVKVSVWP